MGRIPWQMYHIGALSVLGLSAILYSLGGAPFPRPMWLFALVGISITMIGVRVLTQSVSRFESLLLLSELVISNIFIRGSQFFQLLSLGQDTQIFAKVTSKFIESGGLGTSGMYPHDSPLFPLLLALGRLLTGPYLHQGPSFGLGAYGDGGLTLILASLFPVMIAAIGYRATDNFQIGLLSAVFATIFPLFLRSSVSLQPEGMVLVQFSTIILLALVYHQEAQKYTLVVLLFVMGALVYTHFFYSFAAASILLLTVVFVPFFQCADRFKWDIVSKRMTRIYGIGVIIMAFIAIHIIWSTIAVRAVSIASGVFSISISSSIIELFVPSSGTVSKSISSGATESTFLTRSIRFFPLAIVSLFGMVGSLVELRRQCIDGAFVLMGVGASSVTGVFLITQIGPNLHFRLYYFVSIFLVIIAAYGLIRLWDYSILYHVQLINRGERTFIAGLLLVLCVTAPMSPFANSVDSPISKSDGYVTQSQLLQSEIIDDTPQGKYMTNVSDEAFLGHNYNPSNTTNPALYLTVGVCPIDTQISDSGQSGYNYCIKTDNQTTSN